MESENHYWARQALKTTRILWVAILTAPIPAIIICEFSQAPLAEMGSQLPLVGLRTAFYSLAILLFPVMRLFRNRSLLRPSEKHVSAQRLAHRFTSRVFFSLLLAELILVMGLVLCLLGDHEFSFYLLTGLSVLAMILYRPKPVELTEVYS
ncbi:MAG: hypothetical protein K0U68_06275 [Gammaproteobacteria bacterium]|nr:hypothetical protein [Gammaproteobacteria bacterium]